MTGDTASEAIDMVQVSVRVGRLWRLRDVSMRVRAGEAFGVTGPSGSGKSLLLGVCATVVRPDRGAIRVMGLDARAETDAVRRIIGYAPVDLGCDPRATVRADLDFFAAAYRLAGEGRRKAVDDTMERFGLGPLAGARMGELSRGFERRVVLARAWLHRPAVLILDDPATGLDDDGCDRLAREILRHLDAGGSALIASGRRDELARWCDHIGVMTDTGVTVVGASSDAPPRSPEVGQRVADRRD